MKHMGLNVSQKEEREVMDIVESKTKECCDAMIVSLQTRFPEVVVSKIDFSAGRIRLAVQFPAGYPREEELVNYANDLQTNIAYPELHFNVRSM